MGNEIQGVPDPRGAETPLALLRARRAQPRYPGLAQHRSTDDLRGSVPDAIPACDGGLGLILIRVPAAVQRDKRVYARLRRAMAVHRRSGTQLFYKPESRVSAAPLACCGAPGTRSLELGEYT